MLTAIQNFETFPGNDSPLFLQVESMQPQWYAAYTCANHEKRVAEQLGRRSVEHLLPLYEVSRRWQDRQVRLQLPLFPGYVFVRLALRERIAVLQTPGVVRLIGCGRTPTPVAEEEIAGLRRALGEGSRIEPHPYLTTGRRVRITAGAFAGYQGILVRRKGSVRVVVSIDLIQRAMVVEADASCIEPAGPLWHARGARRMQRI
jgi:transcription antitermination factor NusG